jgi:hypothetical protein
MKMRELAPALWQLLAPADARGPRRPAAPRRGRARDNIRRRYDELVRQMKALHSVRVRRWRRRTSGCAWIVRYQDGTLVRLIEAPYPAGPVSCAVFLHEIAHHAIGFNTHRLRCLEEYEAWRWALDAMRAWQFNVTPAVERRMTESVRWAVRKARGRGLKKLPAELLPFA